MRATLAPPKQSESACLNPSLKQARERAVHAGSFHALFTIHARWIALKAELTISGLKFKLWLGLSLVFR
eukprot:6189701-Pleurochrysis_carterae.AAC.1